MLARPRHHDADCSFSFISHAFCFSLTLPSCKTLDVYQHNAKKRTSIQFEICERELARRDVLFHSHRHATSIRGNQRIVHCTMFPIRVDWKQQIHHVNFEQIATARRVKTRVGVVLQVTPADVNVTSNQPKNDPHAALVTISLNAHGAFVKLVFRKVLTKSCIGLVVDHRLPKWIPIRHYASHRIDEEHYPMIALFSGRGFSPNVDIHW